MTHFWLHNSYPQCWWQFTLFPLCYRKLMLQCKGRSQVRRWGQRGARVKDPTTWKSLLWNINQGLNARIVAPTVRMVFLRYNQTIKYLRQLSALCLVQSSYSKNSQVLGSIFTWEALCGNVWLDSLIENLCQYSNRASSCHYYHICEQVEKSAFAVIIM